MAYNFKNFILNYVGYFILFYARYLFINLEFLKIEIFQETDEPANSKRKEEKEREKERERERERKRKIDRVREREKDR